ncbi:MAG: dienelactone hydrolase family protein [Gammaproteobacteria bacterium]|nr:dienelactone hydrolase family protein [Gammaproteobacteria bacterium]MDH3862715.1 dienelactone hydrolase family protein [Gammaproteobacteria bacterium]MDH3905890.1 dienelactone hydrolase family protein [Gammaproteobacteria bacterium]MDH3908032.1 dienelactone hydrolase family protein [Gammaproteobacteria bacterium]MDH4004874.1 dienelactone hydrolase family protein [Gammaproteobacteria bacterium]
MSYCTPGRGLMLAVQTLTLCVVAACGRTDTGPVEEQQAAAVENVEAMAREHADDTAEPSEAALVEPQREITAERLAYAEVDDEVVYGHFAFPSDMIEPLPAVIMIHEWWGLNDNIRAMAERLAAEGYIVLAVDLFGGEAATSPEVARQLMLRAVENRDSVTSNIEQAYRFVKETAGAPRIASLGWCFGGGWSFNTAVMFPQDLDAAVIYYGQVTDDEARLSPLDVPILGLFGSADRGIKLESVRRFEGALERLGKDYEIHVYEGAGHAFANPSGRNFNAGYAEDAWTRTLEFLSDRLSPDTS